MQSVDMKKNYASGGSISAKMKQRDTALVPASGDIR